MNGILKSDEMITRFFRIATQMCIENVYQQLNEDRMNPPQAPPKREKYYNMCDSFIKLVSLLIKNTADAGNPTPKLNLLNKVRFVIDPIIGDSYFNLFVEVEEIRLFGFCSVCAYCSVLTYPNSTDPRHHRRLPAPRS